MASDRDTERALRRRQVRRRRIAALGILVVLVGVLVIALTGAAGGDRLGGVARSTARIPVVPDAAADARVRHLAKEGRPVYCGGRNKPYVALTFNGGPGASTQPLVSALSQGRTPATFFLVGKNVAQFPEGVRLQARAGALGDNTYHQVAVTSLALTDMAKELADTAKAITAVTHEPVHLFRPPFGSRTAGTDAVARAEGMLQIVWDVDTHDTEGADANAIARNVAKEVKPGSIVLFHEDGDQVIPALPAVQRVLVDKGLQPVTVPELMALDPPSAAQLAAGPEGCGLRPPPEG